MTFRAASRRAERSSGKRVLHEDRLRAQQAFDAVEPLASLRDAYFGDALHQREPFALLHAHR